MTKNLLIKKLLKPVYRFYLGLKYVIPPNKYFLRWLVNSNETTNFTYHLNKHNNEYLINFIANAAKCDYALVKKYFDEIEEDKSFFELLSKSISNSKFKYKTDLEIRLGRRISWYALIRILKPKVVTESGIDKGLGSCICTYAIYKNSLEGYPGKYFGIDINPDAGYMIPAEFKEYFELLTGDSVSVLKSFNGKINIHIYDCHLSENHENQEYESLLNKMDDNGIIISDNAHNSEALFHFALINKKRFSYFHEIPESHFYRGEGVGFLFWD